MNRLQSLLANKHTSGAALVYALASGLGHVAGVWFPEHKAQLEETIQTIKELCITYGLVSAGDASKFSKDVKEVDAKVQETAKAVITGDTSILTKTALDSKAAPTDVPTSA